jgi:hypothetical protein
MGGKDPFRILRARTGSELASKGSLKQQSWYKMTPKAHISALVE